MRNLNPQAIPQNIQIILPKDSSFLPTPGRQFPAGPTGPAQEVKEPPKYTDEEMSMIEERYRNKDEHYKKVGRPLPIVMEQYRKSLVAPQIDIPRETIVFDPNTRKWKIEKVT